MSELFGLIGEKLTHSVSPKIHSKFFKIINMDAKYDLYEIKKEELKAEFNALKNKGIKGLNVTIPYKLDIMDCLDKISTEAEKIGAVNTICFKDNETIGYNTDYYGFGRMLEKNNILVEGKKVVVLGAGGAAKAVIQYFLDNNPSELLLVSRDKKRASKEFSNINIIDYEDLKNYEQGDIIVNCTPVGMYPKVEATPVNEECISKFSAAVDLIYNPEETLFLKLASKNGLKAVNGLYMLVGQAMAAEELWNNITISEKTTDDIFENM